MDFILLMVEITTLLSAFYFIGRSLVVFFVKDIFYGCIIQSLQSFITNF